MIELLSSIEFWFGISLGIIFDEIGRKALRARLGIEAISDTSTGDADTSAPTEADESAPTESE